LPGPGVQSGPISDTELSVCDATGYDDRLKFTIFPVTEPRFTNAAAENRQMSPRFAFIVMPPPENRSGTWSELLPA
jgi:hypothetical protein